MGQAAVGGTAGRNLYEREAAAEELREGWARSGARTQSVGIQAAGRRSRKAAMPSAWSSVPMSIATASIA